MNVQEAMLMFSCIERRGADGVGLIELSRETRLDTFQLKKYLVGYPEYFTSLEGSSNYRISEHGRFSGNINSMLDELAVENRAKTKRKMVLDVFNLLVGIAAITYLTLQSETLRELLSLAWAS